MNITGNEFDNYDVQVNVDIDPKIELLGIVQYLAGEPTIMKNNSKYSNDIGDYFNDYRENEIISIYIKLRRKGFAFHLPPKLMLYVDENLSLIDNIDIDEDIIKIFENKLEIEKFLFLLKEFAKKSNFYEFYKNNYEFYRELILYVRAKIDESGCMKSLVNYYGFRQNSYNIIIQPLSIGGYGVRIPATEDTFDSYTFTVVPENTVDFISLVLHEFGHTYINPLTRKNIEAVSKYDYLYEPIKNMMVRQAYPTWEFCANEHIVRAVTNRILFNIYDEKISMLKLERDIEKNFRYVNIFYKKLLKYEAERDRYETFNDFYTEFWCEPIENDFTLDVTTL